MIMRILAVNGHGAALGATEGRYFVILSKTDLNIGDEIAGCFDDEKHGAHLGRDMTTHDDMYFDVAMSDCSHAEGKAKLDEFRLLAENREAVHVSN